MPETTERDFLVPDLGEGLEEVIIADWLVGVGDRVVLNQPLCFVETAKAVVEVPSPYEGAVVALGGDEGETLAVGTLLARFETASGADVLSAGPDTPVHAVGVDTRPEPTLVGYGHDGAIDRSRRTRGGAAGAEVPAPPSAPTQARTDRPLSKPPVRLLARRLGVDLSQVAPGSGPGGIVTRADVEAAAPQTGGVPTGTGAAVRAVDTVIPVRGVRALIADRMTASRSHIPDATCGVTADCTRLLEVRAALNDHAARQGLDPVVTPFSLLSRLVVQALGANPVLNATFVEDVPEIRVHDTVNLGIGTATERGLVVTVVRSAAQLTLYDLSSEMARLADGARAGTLGPSDLQGSTFTISNFGALGLDEGIPIINYPEAAILGVGSIRPRPHVVDGAVVARPTAALTLAFDHRVCDGVEAGRFLGRLRELVEAPDLALLLS